MNRLLAAPRALARRPHATAPFGRALHLGRSKPPTPARLPPLLRPAAPAAAPQHRRGHATTAATGRCVNAVYQPGTLYPDRAAGVPQTCTRTPCLCHADSGTPDTAGILARHAADKKWSAAEVAAAHAQHSLFTWVQHEAASKGALHVVRSEGVYLYTDDGRRYLDWNSQAMCVNHGHTVHPEIIAAVVHQLETLPYAYPGAFVTPVRARLCALLAELCPGDLNTFMFPSGGAEANETAIRMARMYTGRHKILNRHRSYHGATQAAIAATGDQRRWPAESGATGFVKFFDPTPYSFSRGATEAEICRSALVELEEQVAYEGPHTIAAIMLEPVTGTNGILPPPQGYLEGVQSLCREHGILFICDEVMSGFGRTGKLFGFCHGPSVVPDIFTFAKGVNGAFLPLGGVGVRDHVAEHFRKNNVAIGSTYNSHPAVLASAYAALQVMLKSDLLGNVQRMHPHLKAGMQQLLDDHPSVKQARCVGLFGCLDIQKNRRGEFIAGVASPPPPAMVEFKKALLDKGVFTMMRGHNVFCNPPLVINPDEIAEGIAALDACLPILDAAMED